MPCVNHPDVVADLSTCAQCGKSFCGDCVINLRGQTVCAGCKRDRVQDIKSGSAPDDVELAGRWTRFLGMFVDNLVVNVPMNFIMQIAVAGTATAASATGNPPLGTILLLNLVQLLAFTVYEALMLSARGQTLGKMAAKMKVVSADGSDITPAQAWTRAAARLVMAMTVILGVIDVLMIFSKQRTTLHDRMAKTRVVRWKP